MISNRNIPDILYHGTTMLRWKLIEKEGYISPNNEGHVYFTNDISDAKGYTFARYLQDLISPLNRPRSPRRMKKVTNEDLFGCYSYCYNINPNLKDSVILKIISSDIVHKLELDTEWDSTYHLSTNIPLEHVSIQGIYKLSDEDLCERKFIESLVMQSISYKQRKLWRFTGVT
jgi:hypothetical protein